MLQITHGQDLNSTNSLAKKEKKNKQENEKLFPHYWPIEMILFNQLNNKTVSIERIVESFQG